MTSADTNCKPTAFLLGPSADGIKYHETVYLTRLGSDPEPVYHLDHGDPTKPTHKNSYTAALYDSYNPDVLFGDVQLKPDWHLAPLDSRSATGAVPAPPEPALPSDFTIQLYNPDLQVRVREHAGSLLSSPHWDFSVPQSTFRQPSASTLDRAQHDPAADATLPRVNFSWRQGRLSLSRDLTCYVTGRSTDALLPSNKKRSKEPDIAVAQCRTGRELAVYAPNLARVEIEDPKGLEVVLLLSAVVVRDVYHASLRKAFNITEALRRDSGDARSASSSLLAPASQQAPPLPSRTASLPLTDPHTQWTIDAETARLRAQVAAEEHAAARAQHERARAADAEAHRLRALVDAEARAARDQRAAVDAETERLRVIYGQGPAAPSPAMPPRQRQQQQHLMSGAQQASLPPSRPAQAQQPRPQRLSNGLYAPRERSGAGGGRAAKKTSSLW